MDKMNPVGTFLIEVSGSHVVVGFHVDSPVVVEPDYFYFNSKTFEKSKESKVPNKFKNQYYKAFTYLLVKE